MATSEEDLLVFTKEEFAEKIQEAVRVSGMVALERLAQKNPEYKTATSHILDFLASYHDDAQKEKEIARTLLVGRRQYMPWIARVFERDVTG